MGSPASLDHRPRPAAPSMASASSGASRQAARHRNGRPNGTADRQGAGPPDKTMSGNGKVPGATYGPHGKLEDDGSGKQYAQPEFGMKCVLLRLCCGTSGRGHCTDAVGCTGGTGTKTSRSLPTHSPPTRTTRPTQAPGSNTSRPFALQVVLGKAQLTRGLGAPGQGDHRLCADPAKDPTQ